MSSPNNTVIVNPDMSSDLKKTPSPQPQQSTSTSPKVVVGQGNHQLLFNKPPSPNKAKPSEEKDTSEDPSALKPTLSTSNLLADMENESSEATTVLTPVPLPSTTKKPKKATGITVIGAPSTRRRPAANTKEAAKKHSNPLVVSQMPGMKQVLSSLAGGLNLSDYIVRVDNKGTRWLKKFSDEPPRKLTDIPIDNRHNEIEITSWQPITGKYGPTYLLYTAKGVKYWANTAATKVIDFVQAHGKIPGNCTIVVKHTKDFDFQFGVRFADEEERSSSSSSSVTVSTPPLKDNDVDDDNIDDDVFIDLD